MEPADAPMQDVPDEVIERFAARLGAFAEELPGGEQELLRRLLFAAARPVDRVRWLGTASLDAREQAVVEALEEEIRPG